MNLIVSKLILHPLKENIIINLKMAGMKDVKESKLVASPISDFFGNTTEINSSSGMDLG